MTNFECFVVITICFLAFWGIRVAYFWAKCRDCIDGLVMTYCLMDVKSCSMKSEGDVVHYELKTTEEDILPTKLYRPLAELFNTFISEEIITNKSEHQFIPSYNKEKLVACLDNMLEQTADVLSFYDKLDLEASLVMKTRYLNLKEFYELFHDKVVLVKKMPGRVISFFPKA